MSSSVGFSPAELSYLKTSLSSNPPIRPDSRLVNQFRPLQATTNFLANAYGSSRVRTVDGGECIVGIKAKVVRTAQESGLVKVDVDIAGLRDDHPLPVLLASTFQSILLQSQPLIAKLKLTSRFSYKLFVDGLIISHASHPLNLLSLAIYLALMSCRLPLLVSSTDDASAEEIPVFDDDWDHAIKLVPDITDSSSDWRPPLLFVLAVIGENLFVDPTNEEEQVAEAGLFLGWANDKVTAPLRLLNLGGVRQNGVSASILTDSYKMVSQVGPEVTQALDLIIKLETQGEISMY